MGLQGTQIFGLLKIYARVAGREESFVENLGLIHGYVIEYLTGRDLSPVDSRVIGLIV
jgi:predicted metallopeptidase